jgi:hypothetical protein
VQYLLDIASQRPPDFVIQRDGRPYLRRWYLIPRNAGMNVYLHHIMQDDLDRALHDHPWDNTTIILKGRYVEITPQGKIWRWAGDVVHRRAEDLHRLIVGNGEAWTLFITGPKRREWGFACEGGWVHWEDFVDPLDSGKIGKGCGG